MSKNALVIGLAMFAGAAASAGGQTSAMPKDACALLTVAEIQEMAGTLVKDGTPGKVAALGSVTCTYTWGPANYSASGQYQLNVLATDASKAFPGMSTALIKQAMAARVKALGVRPELEVFDTGHLVQVKELVRDGLLDDPVMIQLCMGIAYGAPDDPGTFMALVNQLPPGAVFSAFSISRMQLPFVAMAVLAGGNVRVGLEDNLYSGRGQLATNADLVRRAVSILEAMNVSVLKPADVRAQLQLTPPE